MVQGECEAQPGGVDFAPKVNDPRFHFMFCTLPSKYYVHAKNSVSPLKAAGLVSKGEADARLGAEQALRLRGASAGQQKLRLS